MLLCLEYQICRVQFFLRRGSSCRNAVSERHIFSCSMYHNDICFQLGALGPAPYLCPSRSHSSSKCLRGQGLQPWAHRVTLCSITFLGHGQRDQHLEGLSSKEMLKCLLFPQALPLKKKKKSLINGAVQPSTSAAPPAQPWQAPAGALLISGLW